MKKYILLLTTIICMGLLLVGCNQSDPDPGSNEFSWDRRPMVRINGELYLDTGRESDINGRCGVMDGEITSAVEATEIPIKDNQSNFGDGYGYQYVDENNIDPYINDKWIRFEKEMVDVWGSQLITLDDLLLVNHPILSNTPMLLTTIQDLTQEHDFSIETFNSSGANNFVYTLFSSPHISYISIGSSLDMDSSPIYFIVTSDKYQLLSNLKVGLSKQEVLNLYNSYLPCESFEWDYTTNDILQGIISYDEVYCFYGIVTSEEAEKYSMESFSLAPSGLYIFLENGRVVAFSNFFPGAN